MMSRSRLIAKNCSVKISVIWLLCAFSFCCFFRMALRSSSSLDDNDSHRSSISGSSILYAEQRSILYAKMAKDLDDNGAVFLKQGETSQSLSLSDLFTLKDGTVTPVLKAADPPVRANVLNLSPEYSIPISEAVKDVFLPYFDKGEICCSFSLLLSPEVLATSKPSTLEASFTKILSRNSSMYHFSLFHASHHKTPVPATEAEIEAEANAVKLVAETICPLHIILDRVVLTSTGVLLGCWQVGSGTDPTIIRAKLKMALPRAPENQLYHEAMLHTSFARLLGSPDKSPEKGHEFSGVEIFHELVNRLSSQIRGMKATVSELWYVEEHDLLALALNGKMKIRKFRIGCSGA